MTKKLLHHLPENLRRVTGICVGFRYNSKNKRSAKTLKYQGLEAFEGI